MRVPRLYAAPRQSFYRYILAYADLLAFFVACRVGFVSHPLLSKFGTTKIFAFLVLKEF